MRSAITLGLGILVATATPGLRAQAKPSTPVAKPAAQAAKPASNPAAKTGAKSGAKQPGKAKAAKPARRTVEKASTPGSAPAAAASEIKQARRDPFESLIGRQNKAGGPNLPPGKLGLQVSTLRLDGIVRS